MRALSRLLALTLLGLGMVPGCVSTSRAEPLVTHFGLGNLLHPIQEPETVSLPNCYLGHAGARCKEHVYIFGVNGLNPLCLGNFNGLLGYLRKQGFTHTYFGQLYTSHWFAGEIRKIRQQDPEARIVLIGFSLGANYVRAIANNLNEDGTRVDLLVYLVGDLIYDAPDSKPANVCRIVNIRSNGLILLGGDLLFNGEDIEGARNCMLKGRHILAPSRRETLTLLLEELLVLACAPVVSGVPPPATVPTRNTVRSLAVDSD